VVVHREAEEDDEEEERQPGDDRAVGREPGQWLGPVVLEDEHEHAVGRADGKQVEDDRLQRHDDRAEGDERRVPVARDADVDIVAEPAAHPVRDVRDCAAGGRSAGAQCFAVHVALLARYAVRPVRVDQRVASRRLADRAVLERLRTSCDDSRNGDGDEREPRCDRTPGASRAPAAIRRDRPHRGRRAGCVGVAIGPGPR
jgi:hypothetical protein